MYPLLLRNSGLTAEDLDGIKKSFDQASASLLQIERELQASTVFSPATQQQQSEMLQNLLLLINQAKITAEKTLNRFEEQKLEQDNVILLVSFREAVKQAQDIAIFVLQCRALTDSIERYALTQRSLDRIRWL